MPPRVQVVDVTGEPDCAVFLKGEVGGQPLVRRRPVLWRYVGGAQDGWPVVRRDDLALAGPAIDGVLDADNLVVDEPRAACK